MKLSERTYYGEVMESLEKMEKYAAKSKDDVPVLPLSTIAGIYAIRFLDTKDCAVLLEIENKILNGYDLEIEKKKG